MLKNVKQLILFIFVLYSQASISAKNNYPSGLLYHQKPIDSLCFSFLENKTMINLRDCGLDKEKLILQSSNKMLIEKGYIGFDWRNSKSNERGISYYKVYPINESQYWVHTINSTGGSGEFTSLELITRKNTNFLTIKTLMMGDRCNSGIDVVTEKKNTIWIEVNLTPYDILNLTKKESSRVKAYSDIAACAACCIGVAKFKMTRDKPTELQFKQVLFSKDLPEQGSYQACFNQQLQQLTTTVTLWDMAHLEKLSELFYKNCVPKSA